MHRFLTLAILAAMVSLPMGAKQSVSSVMGENSVAPEVQGPRRITGTILDAQGQPVIGAAVMVPGTAIGAVTDENGSYVLDVPEGVNSVEVSSIGFKTQTIALGAGSSYNVALDVDNELLEESVVVGYGVQKKVNLTGSVSSVDFTKQSRSRPVTNAAAALAGLSAGLQVIQGSGAPGAESVGMNIRGIGTLNSSGPYVLVDGMEMSLADINPNDIESISVLKDAASCAIYGNRGANGVILVTTKSGSRDGKVRVTYSGKFSMDTPTRLVDFVSNYADYMEWMNESCENMNTAPIYGQATIDLWRSKESDPDGIADSGYPNKVAYPNTNWYDEIYKHKIMQEHSVSVTGTEGRSNYSLGMTYLNNPGIIDGAGLKKYSINLKLTTNITDWLQVGGHIWGYHQDRERNSYGNLTAWSFLKAVPGMYPYYDGKYGGPEAVEEDGSISSPLQQINPAFSDSYYRMNRLFTTTHVQVKFLKDFTAKTQFGYEYHQQHHKSFAGNVALYSFSRLQNSGGYPTTYSTANVYMYHTYNYQWKWTNTLNWAHTFGLHDVSALLGFEEGRYYSTYLDTQKQGIIDPTITDPSTVTSPIYINGTDGEFAYQSWFGRINYAYNNRYLLELNARYDGSSRFAKENRWGFFPSASAAWRISQEDFMSGSGIDELKLRASIGKLGNNSVDNYAYHALYTAGYTYLGSSKVNAFYVSTLPNANISWEETTTYDIGLDFGFLRNRLTGTVDFYSRQTSGILYRPSIYLTIGNKNAPLMNLAEVNNKGVELTLTWQDHVDDFLYSISGNVTFNRNRVTKYKGKFHEGYNAEGVWETNLGDVSSGGLNRILEDHEINEFYLRHKYHGDGSHNGVNGGPKDGMIRTEEDMQWLRQMVADGKTFLPRRNISKRDIWYGDYIFEDYNGDGIFGSDADRSFDGCSTNPKVNFGLQFNASWKGFDLALNFTGATGFKAYWCEIGQNKSTTVYGLQLPQWVASDHYFYDPTNPSDPRTNTSSKNPRLLNANSGSQNETSQSDLYLYDCKFLKLRNATLGYTLPANLTQKLYAESIRVYFSGENLFTLTPFPGMDPEMRAGVGYALIRQFAFGVNITF